MISARPIPPRGRDGRLCRLADRPECHFHIGEHGLVRPKPDHMLAHDFGDQVADAPRFFGARTRRSALALELGAPTRIILKCGETILIDLEDAWIVETHYIGVHRLGATPYAYVTSIASGRRCRLARLLCEAPKEMVVDHINGDGLDNRRANLRVVTSQGNNRNRAKMRGTSSIYKGVSRKGGRWFAYLYVNYRQIGLGLHGTEADAARAYDAAARQHFGSCAALNFPLPGEQSAHRRDFINLHRS